MFAPPPLPRTLEAAVRDLGSARAETRGSAIVDLVRHATRDDETRRRAIPLLERTLADTAPAVRAASALALADLGAREALPALLVAVEDDAASVRQMALSALGELADPRASPRLRRALADARPDVRYQALIAFARVTEDDAEVDAALADALADGDGAVRYIALRIAEERLERSGATDDRLPRLVAGAGACLEDPAGDVVLAAALLLARRGHARAVEIVAEVVERGASGGRAPAREDERAAVELSGELDLRRVVPALERRAWGLARHVQDTCAFHARVALARLGHPRALAEIDHDLDSTRRETVEAAVVTAGRARLVVLRERIARLTRSAADPDLVAEALALLADGRT